MRAMRCLYTALVIVAAACGLAGQPVMPEWLVNYPGASVQTKSFRDLVETRYLASGTPGEVRDFYRVLFESRTIPFRPNSDGVGVVVRASVDECNLFLSIRGREEGGTEVQVSCAAKGESAANMTASSSVVTLAGASSGGRAMELHNQHVAELGIHRVYEDAPPPPLVWPAWLVHASGSRLHAQQATDQSHNACLKATYTTTIPMTELFTFYKDLLTANNYPVYRGGIGTGHTISGVSQNAYGDVEGDNYPNGSPGPRTEIKIHFSRDVLNGPIRVDLRFTTYAFKAPRRAER